MLRTIICTFCTILFAVLLYKSVKEDWDSTPFILIISIFIGLWFIINLFLLIAEPINTRVQIKEFESTRLTIQQQRDNNVSEIERAALIKEIIDHNQWLAREQYWAKSLWLNWYYDKAILDLKPIN